MLGSKRIVSSTACGTSSGRPASSAAWSGWRSRVRNVQPSWLPVVSWPPTIRLADHRAHFVVREPLAFDFGDHERAHEVVAGRARVAARAGRRRSRSVRPARPVAASACSGVRNPKIDAQRVGPADEPCDVGVGNADQAADDAQRQRRRRRDEVAGAVGAKRRERCRRPSRPPSTRIASTARGVNAFCTSDRSRRCTCALVGEHQAAVPVAQRPVGDSHQVEVPEPDAHHARVASERLDVGVPQHDHDAGVGFARQRTGARGLAQHVVEVVAERAPRAPPFGSSTARLFPQLRATVTED